MSRKLPDRVWVRPVVVHGHELWQLVAVVAGSKTTAVYPSREEAERQRAILAAAVERGQIDAPATWSEAVELFLDDRKKPSKRRPDGGRKQTLAAYERALKAVGRVLEDPDPLTLTADDAHRFLEARKAETNRSGQPISGATVRGELEAVTIMQRWFADKGWLPRSTWAEVPRPEVLSSKRPLRSDELARFLRAAKRLSEDPRKATAELGGKANSERRLDAWERWYAAAWLLVHGACVGEVERLRVGDIDLVTGEVEITDRVGARTKTRSRVRTLPILAREALQCLQDTFRGVPPGELAFPVHTRAPPKGRERVYDRSSWLARRCAITCELAGIVPAVSPHELRHTVATLAIVAGADIHSVQALLGHADARMTARVYSHATSTERAMGAARIVSGHFDRLLDPKPILKVAR